MEVIVKVRFNSSKQSLEKFGQNKYIIYLPFGQDGDSINVLISILSRQLGVPIPRIKCRGQDYNKDWVFETS